MRDDYFSKNEIQSLLRINGDNFYRITSMQNAFPAHKVGGRYVIPKKQFFA